MTKAAERTLAATKQLAAYVGTPGRVEASGNVPEGWIFSFEHDGQEYIVEVAAATLSDEEIEEQC